jgi:hypothetical protein
MSEAISVRSIIHFSSQRTRAKSASTGYPAEANSPTQSSSCSSCRHGHEYVRSSRDNPRRCSSESSNTYILDKRAAAMPPFCRLGYLASPPRVLRIPNIPHLQENNARQGFITTEQYCNLVAHCPAYRRKLLCASQGGKLPAYFGDTRSWIRLMFVRHCKGLNELGKCRRDHGNRR